jgi:endonuclease-3 related protein
MGTAKQQGAARRAQTKNTAGGHAKLAKKGPVPMAATSTAAARLHAIYAALLDAYGPQHWWPAETDFEMIVGAYLTQATSWRSVERSLNNLRSAGLLHLDGVRNTRPPVLHTMVRPSGFMQRKVRSIRAFVRFLDTQYQGSLDVARKQHTDALRKQLLSLPGVGPETADSILLYAMGHRAVVVDEYFRRVASRHGLLRHTGRGKEQDAELRALATAALRSRVHATELEDAKELHALIVEVGKRHCGPTAHCKGCPLEKFLPRNAGQRPGQDV